MYDEFLYYILWLQMRASRRKASAFATCKDKGF